MNRTTTVETPRRSLLLASLVGAALLFGANTADAARTCAPHDKISKQLENRYAEQPVGGGLAQSGQLLQVFAAKDGESWTVVLTRPDGVSCVVASGRYWQALSPKVEGPQV